MELLNRDDLFDHNDNGDRCNFVQIPHWILADDRFEKPIDKLVFMGVLSLWPIKGAHDKLVFKASQRKLADVCALNQSSINRSLQRLAKSGFIKRYVTGTNRSKLVVTIKKRCKGESQNDAKVNQERCKGESQNDAKVNQERCNVGAQTRKSNKSSGKNIDFSSERKAEAEAKSQGQSAAAQRNVAEEMTKQKIAAYINKPGISRKLQHMLLICQKENIRLTIEDFERRGAAVSKLMNLINQYPEIHTFWRLICKSVAEFSNIECKTLNWLIMRYDTEDGKRLYKWQKQLRSIINTNDGAQHIRFAIEEATTLKPGDIIGLYHEHEGKTYLIGIVVKHLKSADTYIIRLCDMKEVKNQRKVIKPGHITDKIWEITHPGGMEDVWDTEPIPTEHDVEIHRSKLHIHVKDPTEIICRLLVPYEAA